MFPPLARAASALLIAPFLLFGSALAPVHEHPAASGHTHGLVHSHFELHHLDASHVDDGPEIEQDVERIIWLDSPIIHQTTYHVSPDASLGAAIFEQQPSGTSWSPTPFDDVAPVHGPPRGNSSLRGPPSLPA